MTAKTPMPLDDEQLSLVAGGADAEPQDILMYLMPGNDSAAARLPGMHKYANVTLKRG